jgi:uncharacterized damage-inducible protein DinB
MPMAALSQSQLLAKAFQQSRQLNKFYISKLKEVDPYEIIEFGGEKFNSIYWLTAHLIWAENNLLTVQTGGNIGAPEWISHYTIFSDGSLHQGHGSYKELLDLMNELHTKAISHLESLTDEQLDEENISKMSLGGQDTSKRFSVIHAIRHESTHTGHFGWICKMKKIKTI